MERMYTHNNICILQRSVCPLLPLVLVKFARMAPLWYNDYFQNPCRDMETRWVINITFKSSWFHCPEIITVSFLSKCAIKNAQKRHRLISHMWLVSWLLYLKFCSGTQDESKMILRCLEHTLTKVHVFEPMLLSVRLEEKFYFSFTLLGLLCEKRFTEFL